jgi:hypothetical protein
MQKWTNKEEVLMLFCCLPGSVDEVLSPKVDRSIERGLQQCEVYIR